MDGVWGAGNTTKVLCFTTLLVVSGRKYDEAGVEDRVQHMHV
jgi:hypothetical protein